MSGGGGNDLVKGESGIDLINGDEGDDRLHGGPDSDWIWRPGPGPDRHRRQRDTIAGGSQTDNFWVDAIDVVIDAAADEQSLGYLHEVEAFFAVSYNGRGSVSTPIGKELDGADLPDPLPRQPHGPVTSELRRFPAVRGGRPNQGRLLPGQRRRLHLLAPLSAGTDAHPDFVRRLVADLGDGTMPSASSRRKALRTRRRGSVDRVERQLKYARFGRENSLWVPIVEKAYAFFRKQQGNYPSLSSGDGKHHGHLHATTEPMELEEVVTLLQVIDWVERGSPAGVVANAINDGGSSTQLDRPGAGERRGGTPAPAQGSATRRLSSSAGMRILTAAGSTKHTVDHVEFDDNGQPVVLVLRDPYGKHRRLADFARIYFCIGRAVIWRP